ncbi:MAG: acyl carrier protein [Muribaculaceae bacterium]|nr:acyl carrier protein [Muribaculaceae bacterium]
MDEIREKLVNIIVERLAVTPDQVTDDASFVQDLGADSLDTADLLMIFETEFEVKIPDEATEKIQTVGDALKYIEQAKEA